MKKGLSLLIAVFLLMTALPTVLADAPEGAPVVRIFNNSGAAATSTTGTGSTEAAYKLVQQAIYDATGIWVEGIFPPTNGDDAKQQLNMLLSSGEDIDIFWGNWRDYYDTGSIMKWNDVIDDDVFQIVYQAWDEVHAWESVTDAAGNIWGMPRSTRGTPYPLFFRQDWLDELGVAMPTTIDELNDYLYKVKEADPYGNGATIPLLAYRLNELEFCFVGGYVNGGNGMWLDEDGSVKPIYLAEGYTDFLEQMRTWYKDGIIPQEAFSWDNNTMRDYISKCQSAVNAVWYSSNTLRSVQSTDTYISKYGSFDFDKYQYVYQYQDGITGPNGNFIETGSKAGTDTLMMNSKCDHVDACIKYIAWQYEDWENYMTTTVGLKGIHWRYDPNDPEAETNHTYTFWFDDEGRQMYPDVDGNLGYENKLEYCREFTTSLGVLETSSTVRDTYGRLDQHDQYLKISPIRLDRVNDPGIEANIAWDNTALENACFFSDINTYASENRLKFLIGERDMSEWDAFIQELYDMGLQDMIDEYTRQYNEFMGL